MKSIFLVSTTFEKKEDAERIAFLLLSRKLIACAQLSGPMKSFYRWQGRVATEVEYTLVVKTTSSVFQSVRELITTEHPYELPEIIGKEITHVNSEYLDWVYNEIEETA